MTDAIRELFELLTKKEKSGSDYTGRVTRVDGKTAYVQFDGSDITDTPVALSIGAKAGDSVRIRVADGRAWLVGNDDAPPNDSSEVGYELALTNALIRQLTTEQINGENGWINLLQGTFNYGNRLIWNGSILSLIGKIETSEGKVAGWVIGASTISSGAKGANTALVTLKSGTSGSITVENTYFKSLLDYNGLAMTGDYGETQLTNTGYDIRRKYLGSSTWVHTYITGGSIEVGDSPNQTIIGEGTGDFSGTITEGGTALYAKYMGIVTDGTYYGMRIGNSDSAWIRTTSLGLIPYQAGGASSLGTSGWPFNSVYAKTIFENGTALSNKYAPKSSSDIRLKENVDECEVDSALEVIDRIKLHSFDWKEDGEHQQIGFVADELEEIDEHLANGGGYDADGEMIIKSVDTFYLQGYEIKAIQELHAEVKSLKAEIAELKEIIAVLMEGKS